MGARETELGPRALELGPGPSLTTRELRRRTEHLTAVKIDAHDARELAGRHPGDSVSVVRGDATDLPFTDGSFTGVVSMTTLHHVPSTDAQDRVFAEALRVLEPGGVLCDSRPSHGVGSGVNVVPPVRLELTLKGF